MLDSVATPTGGQERSHLAIKTNAEDEVFRFGVASQA
jgi:hypothetical protein